MDEEISSGSSSEGINEINIENEMEEIENVEVETENVEVETEDPKVGMMFKSSDEIYEYYATYGKKNGFAVSKKNCKKGGDREKKYITLACTRAGKAIIKTSNPVKLRPQTRTGCKAYINAILQPDGMWLLRSLVLEHNHK
ncbi:hypothetical protein ACSBR2_021497 [Camellia fascicularis]